ncbi:hypothetical protein CYY_007758 [Polysphondylium violaceum]|uniref:Lipid-binding serum glycoprotein N-terminal domain-containing protein n=1 Tax=Polysphondylium violaceum TaxID=133409 RepID=A0A8J4PP72_9MYCE|nr:hypothetical protein CYY_007758 [Polysphondylium violaceum]
MVNNRKEQDLVDNMEEEEEYEEEEEEEYEEEEEEEESYDSDSDEQVEYDNYKEKEEETDIKDELLKTIDNKEMIQNGKELIQQSNVLLKEIKELESGKDFYESGKVLVDTVLKKQEAKELMEKGLAILNDAKENKEAQVLINECKQFIDLFSKEEKVRTLISQGKDLLDSIKANTNDPSSPTFDKNKIEALFVQGSELFVDFKENEQNSLYLDKMKKMFFDLKEAESTRITISKGIEEGKKWVESLKEKDPQIKELVNEGEEIFEQLKNNQEVSSLWDDSKKVWSSFLADENRSLATLDSPDVKQLIERGEKIAGELKETLKSHKIVEEVSNRQDVKLFLEKGNKFIHEVKSKEQLIDFLKQNKDFIKEIKNTIVPFITDQLLKVQIPVVNGVTKGFKYEISKLVFAGLGIPPEGVDVNFSETNTITVSVSDFTASLKNFAWSYKQEGFPYLKDTGVASANVEKGFSSISFDIDTNPETNTPEITITDITFKINHLEVIVDEGKVKWLYNYLISKFSESIKDVVEGKIKNTLTGHLNTLTTKINQIVGQYWSKLIQKLNNSDDSKIKEIDDNNNNNDNDESLNNSIKTDLVLN